VHGQQAVKTSSFEFLRVLGEGGFGKVFAVCKKDTKAVYACKTISKQKIAERQREKLIMNERQILV
jgi:serine/threonine protein kinase